MKSNFPHLGLAKLCGWFGITRQAYYQNGWKGAEISIEEDTILKEVLKIRKNHKRMGTRKLHDKLHLFMLERQIKKYECLEPSSKLVPFITMSQDTARFIII